MCMPMNTAKLPYNDPVMGYKVMRKVGGGKYTTVFISSIRSEHELRVVYEANSSLWRYGEYPASFHGTMSLEYARELRKEFAEFYCKHQYVILRAKFSGDVYLGYNSQHKCVDVAGTQMEILGEVK